ncbi:MAG TPA: prephenate dehydratase domain-containing protein [Pyrinomonadaceae bacterium]|nr:prephenate dehydratase domain-containing protein [Pyrinomonadaceae bacterium]
MSSGVNKPTRVAFQGERGAFSEEAALKLLGDEIELVPLKTFDALFSSVDNGEADYVLAPVANTIAGPVRTSLNLLERSSLVMIAEVEIPIEQHLIGFPTATLTHIETVQSHPVALAQCRRFFADNPRLKAIDADDTAGSVAEVVRRGDVTCAAIAGRRAAELYGASIIRESIQDCPKNFTRFVLLAMKGNES